MKWSGLGESNPSCWLGRPLRAITKSALPVILLLSGCQSIPDAPKEVRIPYPVPCLTTSQLPVRPNLVTDAALAKMPDGDLILSLAKDRRQNQGYRAELEAVISGCVQDKPADIL